MTHHLAAISPVYGLHRNKQIGFRHMVTTLGGDTLEVTGVDCLGRCAYAI